MNKCYKKAKEITKKVISDAKQLDKEIRPQPGKESLTGIIATGARYPRELEESVKELVARNNKQMESVVENIKGTEY